jgi:hypothetical protein
VALEIVSAADWARARVRPVMVTEEAPRFMKSGQQVSILLYEGRLVERESEDERREISLLYMKEGTCSSGGFSQDDEMFTRKENTYELRLRDQVLKLRLL